ncbi:MAG: ShlB/FhaC/HecB family hemolysin secretion/activation protein [Rhabdochlamydiaceae bacterium]|nr:ShlB/FhaC/HecB family hemolysin secretion/activation protein [Candidatus Amphrikana amoebophyrae]
MSRFRLTLLLLSFSCITLFCFASNNPVAVSDKDLPKLPEPPPKDAPVKKKRQPTLRSSKEKQDNPRNITLPEKSKNLNKIPRLAPEGDQAVKNNPNKPDRMGNRTNLNKLPVGPDEIDYESGEDDYSHPEKDLNQKTYYREKGEDAPSLGGPGNNLNQFDTWQDKAPTKDMEEQNQEQNQEQDQERQPNLPSKKKQRKSWQTRQKTPPPTEPLKPAGVPVLPSKKKSYTQETIPESESKEYQYQNGILIKQTKGLVLFSDRADMNLVDTSNLTGFHVVNMKLPGKGKQLEAILTPIYLNKPLTRKVINRLINQIEIYYQENDRPIVKVIVPRQGISQGILSLLVIEGKLGQISSKGNIWLSDQRLQQYVKLQPSEVIDERLVRESIDFINRNPFRTVEAVYHEGEQYQSTNIELLVKERTPFRVYAGVDNMGLSSINRTRFFAGFNYGNLFGLDQIVSYQLTVSKDITSYHSHTGSYIIPFPWQNVLEFYGGYSSVHADMPLPFSKSKGRSMQVSSRYTIPLPMYSRYLTHECRFGFDFKRTDNTLEFVENYPVFGMKVNLSQAVVGYSGQISLPHWRANLELNGYWSPGEIFNDQANINYESLRDGAKNKWVYGRGELKNSFLYGTNGEILLRAAAQWSSMTLIPSEEFGIGGLETVRGYEERTLNGDNAFFGSVEIKSPSFNGWIKPRVTREGIKVEDLWQIVAFCDYGIAWLKNDHFNIKPGSQLIEEPKAEYLLGAGPGLRYQIGSYFLARLDAGMKLHNRAEIWGGGRVMVHFMAMASY